MAFVALLFLGILSFSGGKKRRRGEGNGGSEVRVIDYGKRHGSGPKLHSSQEGSLNRGQKE